MRNKSLKEILVKLKNVYPADVWIYRTKNKSYICKEGKLTFNKLYGNYVSILEPKWGEVFAEVIDEELIYIPSVDEFKKWADNEEDEREITQLYTAYKDEETIKNISDEIQEKLEITDNIGEWKSFTEDPSFVNEVFVEKGIYSLSLPANNEMIRLGKPSLPLVTEKTVDKLYYYTFYDDKLKLWSLYMKFNFTHFQLFMYYKAVPMAQ